MHKDITKGPGRNEQAKARAMALRQFRDGDVCPLCNRPMFHAQKLELDHKIPRALGGANGPTRLTHASCNHSAGARLKNRLYRNQPRGRRRRNGRQTYRW